MGLRGDEKRAMLAHIVGEAPQPMTHVGSYTSITWRTFLVRQSWSSVFIMAALIVMLAGGSVAFAAEDTLPGDKLYPIKISLTEPLRDTLAFSASAKAYLEELKIERRVKEAAQLAAKGQLTDAINQQIQKRIEVSAIRVGVLIGQAVGSK